MSYPINYPTPQNANVQIFNRNTGSSGSQSPTQTWVKPQGASFVWFTLIGAGANGDGTNGGGSGVVTNFMCPAFLIPDSLNIEVGLSLGVHTRIWYQYTSGAGSAAYELIGAYSATSATAPTAYGANYFTAMGFFQSVGGQNGSTGTVTASATTFLSGGGSAGGTSTSNYGYSSGPVGAGTDRSGFFQFQPIIVSTGGFGGTITGIATGGIGSGGGVAGIGGPGLVVIITW